MKQQTANAAACIAGIPLFAMSTFPASAMAEPNESRPVSAFVTVQDSEGVTEADFNQETLKNLEDWIVATTRTKVKNSYAEQGLDPKNVNPQIASSAVYVVAGGKKLIVVKIGIDDSVRMVSVMGVIGNEMHRVNCVRDSNQDIPVWSGVCGSKVKEVFGVSLQP